MRDLSRMFAGLVTAFSMTLSTWVSPVQLLAANHGCFYDVNGQAYSLNKSIQGQSNYNMQQLLAAQALIQQQIAQASLAQSVPLSVHSIPQPDCCAPAAEPVYDPYAYYYYPPAPAPCEECWSPCCIIIAAALIGGLCGLAAGCLGGRDGRKGNQGETGPQGPQGLTGAQGSQGISGFPGLPGAPGVAGAPGLPGIAGVAGLPGNNGNNGTNGTAGLPGVAGVAGAPGVAGVAGNNGVAGVAGVAGNNGVAGEAGLPGNNGNNGTNGTAGVAGVAGIAGQPGNNGNNGVNGTAGQAGQDGTDGASCCGCSGSVAGQLPVESVFRFESTMASPGANGTFRGVVITPDNQVLTTAPISVGSMGIQSETLVVKTPADAQGSYRVVFMADEHTPQGSTLGMVEVSTNHGSQVLSFAPSRLVNSSGDQVSFDFTLQH